MLNELQQKLLNMLSWFHDFCEKNNLKYYILYGTLLGAIRHKGFIPWDDDIDVGMPRDDYEKFLKITFNRTFQNYLVESYHNKNKDFYYTFAKIYDTNTTLIEYAKKNITRGVYIDVFPLDGLSSELKTAKRHLKRLVLRKNFFYTRVTGLNKKRAFYKNAAIVISNIIPNRCFNNLKLIKKIDLMSQRYQFETSSFVGSLHSGEGMKEILPKDYFGIAKEYSFEGLKVFGPEKYDEYLKHFYNNYMQLPPKEKRVSNHEYVFCDLNKSYLEK